MATQQQEQDRPPYNHDALQIPMARLPEDKEVAEKTYHSLIPGSNYIDAIGAVHTFDRNGEIKTTSRNLQKALDGIADKPGSPVFAKGTGPVKAPGDDAPVNELQTRAAQVIEQIKKAEAQQSSGGGQVT
jgi:hypothetical protein